MPAHLLDTNIVSALMRDPDGPIAGHITRVGQLNVCTSIVVLAEVRFGIARSRSRRLAAQLAAILGGLEVLPFAEPADVSYGELRSRLEQEGTPISANDMLIAAHALSLGATLVTDNEREFSRVQGLLVENWLRGS